MTKDCIKHFQTTYTTLHYEHFNQRGLGKAYLFGFHYALNKDADLVLQMDADLQHDPKELPKFIELASSQYDVVIGSRLLRESKIKNFSFLC